MSDVRLIDANALKQMLPAPIEDDYKYVHNIIDNAPTVTPDMAQLLAYESGKASADRPTGKWIENELGYYCSRCGMYGWFDDSFCPKCGARMEAENDK